MKSFGLDTKASRCPAFPLSQPTISLDPALLINKEKGRSWNLWLQGRSRMLRTC